MHKRLVHLDQLRGIAALSVLLFHVDKWSYGGWAPDTVLGKLGVYAVSAFFVLSGLTLGLVYAPTRRDDFFDLQFWKKFALKRAFRLLPLLILVTSAYLSLDGMEQWTWGDVALNFTGLFGLFTPGRDIALGAWSIGVEVFCYGAFPMLLYGLNRSKPPVFWWILVVSLAIGGWYAFIRLRTDLAFSDQYGIYVEPLNHFFFFVFGVGASRFVRPAAAIGWRVVFGSAILLFVLWPVGGVEPSLLLCGWTRVALSAATLFAVAAWHGSGWVMPGRVFSWLGQISYSVYLLHPLAYRAVRMASTRYGHESEDFVPVFTVVFTLIAAHYVYRYFEKPLTEKGRAVFEATDMKRR